jgi:putative SOS response-associated peptidase YedK
MCGRYRLSRRKQVIEEYFDTGDWQDDWSPRYNIAPTQPVPVIRQNPKEPVRELSLMRWKLIPSWSKDSSGAASIRSRTRWVLKKSSFLPKMGDTKCLEKRESRLSHPSTTSDATLPCWRRCTRRFSTIHRFDA